MGLFDRFKATGNRHVEKERVEDAATRALHLIEEGNAIEETGQLDEALRCYDAAVNLAPDLARAHMNRGNILLARGNGRRCLECLPKGTGATT